MSQSIDKTVSEEMPKAKHRLGFGRWVIAGFRVNTSSRGVKSMK